MKNNLYWPVYKNLEAELLELANYIHFDDKQANVYSVKLAELLIRCATEIETLSKALYKELGGDMTPIDNKTGTNRDLYFDTDCINLLEDKWHIGKKVVNIIGVNFYFVSDDSCQLTPLLNANKRGKCNWKKAYQAVKHDRINNLNQATIANVVSALAALYLLNVYYRDETIRTYSAGPTIATDTSLGSEIFSILATSKIPDMILADKENEGYDKFTYLIIMSDDLYTAINQAIDRDNEVIGNILKAAGQKYMELGGTLSGNAKNYHELAMEIGGQALVNQIEKEYSRFGLYFCAHRVGVLNKHQYIYGKPLPESISPDTIQ